MKNILNVTLFPLGYVSSADSQYNSAVINTNVIVTSSGEVVWLSHGIFRSSCDINVEYFPFDVQSCNMKWASWTYDGYQVQECTFVTSNHSVTCAVYVWLQRRLYDFIVSVVSSFCSEKTTY